MVYGWIKIVGEQRIFGVQKIFIVQKIFGDQKDIWWPKRYLVHKEYLQVRRLLDQSWLGSHLCLLCHWSWNLLGAGEQIFNSKNMIFLRHQIIGLMHFPQAWDILCHCCVSFQDVYHNICIRSDWCSGGRSQPTDALSPRADQRSRPDNHVFNFFPTPSNFCLSQGTQTTPILTHPSEGWR